MRCHSCHSYIPEGLSEPLKCPQCGQGVNVSPNPELTADEPAVQTITNQNTKTERAFAPYFTIRARLSFGPTHAPLPEATEASISFGNEGFSIVWQEGTQWEKLYYRDLSPPRLDHNSTTLQVKDVETRIAFFSSWGSKLPWFDKPCSKRAKAFKSLLENVQNGLNDRQIKSYQQALR